MSQENQPNGLPASGYELICSSSGRIQVCSPPLQVTLAEDPAGKNLNDYLDDSTTAQIIAAALKGAPLDFSCQLKRHPFVALAEPMGEGIRLSFFAVETDGAPVMPLKAAGLVSRELNSSLHTMFLALSQLRQRGEDLPSEPLAILQQNLYKMLRLSHNFLDAAAAENGELTLTLTEEDVASLCDTLVNRLREPCSLSGIEISYDRPKEALVVRVDREKFERMVLNMISNAVAAQKDGGAVSLVLTDLGDSINLTVFDDGPGLKDGGLNAFRKHRMAEPGAYESLGGAGFGLALTAAFARLHGGQANYSGSGRTAFQIQLPKNYDHATSMVNRMPPDYAGGLDRVLLEMSTVLSKECYC